MMKQTAFRLTAEDLFILDEYRRQKGLASRAEALRFLLRDWAEARVKPLALQCQEQGLIVARCLADLAVLGSEETFEGGGGIR